MTARKTTPPSPPSRSGIFTTEHFGQVGIVGVCATVAYTATEPAVRITALICGVVAFAIYTWSRTRVKCSHPSSSQESDL